MSGAKDPTFAWFKRDGLDLAALENDRIRVVLWPGHGCDLLEIRDKATDCDVLWKNPRVNPPLAAPPAWTHSGRSEFYDTFHGGWILSLPAGFHPCDYHGAPLCTLGEYGQLPWRLDDHVAKAGRLEVEFSVRGLRTPFAVTRRFVVTAGSSRFEISTTVRNESGQRLPIVWLEHMLLGGPIIEAAKVNAAARKIRVPPASRPELVQMQPETLTDWPRAKESGGAWRDCSVVPDRGSDHEHVVTLEDFTEGSAGIWNEKMSLGFSLRWDTQFFPLAWLWATGRGGDSYPLWGQAHVLGLEPATSPPRPFDELVKRGDVKWIGPGASIGTTMSAGFERSRT